MKLKVKLKGTSLLLFVTVPLISVALALGWILFPFLIRYVVSSKVAISPEINSDIYSSWAKPQNLILLKVYVFNVTNPDAVKKGAYPKLDELGPYIFQEKRHKNILGVDEIQDTITYTDQVSYHFRQDLSGDSTLDDVLTVINVPYAAAAIKIGRDLPWPLNDLAKMVLTSKKEPLFIQRTAKQAFFEGWKVPFLEKIEEDVGMKLIPNNTFGFFYGLNETQLGPYTISRGIRDKSSMGKMTLFKNESTLPYWGERNSPCNKLKGGDGTIFPPFISKSSTFFSFNSEFCGSLEFTYNSSMEHEGIKGYHFTPPLRAFQADKQFNCFCEDVEECLEGALDMSPCRDGAPVAISGPHFLNAPDYHREKSGMARATEKDETFVDIEPVTGMMLRVSMKIQLSLILKRVKDVSVLKKVPEMLFPLFWADEYAAITEENVEKVKNALWIIWMVDLCSKIGVVGLAILLSVSIVGRKMKWEVEEKYEENMNTEVQSMLKNNI